MSSGPDLFGMFMEAARLAASASNHRNKQIALSLVPDGVLVVGAYPGWKAGEIITWQTLAESPEKLGRRIREVDRFLTEKWRDEGMPK